MGWICLFYLTRFQALTLANVLVILLAPASIFPPKTTATVLIFVQHDMLDLLDTYAPFYIFSWLLYEPDYILA